MKFLSVFALIALFAGVSYAEETATATTTETDAEYTVTSQGYVNKIFDYTHDAENITRNKLDPARLCIYKYNTTEKCVDVDNNNTVVTEDPAEMVAPGNDIRFDTLPVMPSDYDPEPIKDEENNAVRVHVWVAPSGGSSAEATGE